MESQRGETPFAAWLAHHCGIHDSTQIEVFFFPFFRLVTSLAVGPPVARALSTLYAGRMGRATVDPAPLAGRLARVPHREQIGRCGYGLSSSSLAQFRLISRTRSQIRSLGIICCPTCVATRPGRSTLTFVTQPQVSGTTAVTRTLRRCTAPSWIDRSLLQTMCDQQSFLLSAE